MSDGNTMGLDNACSDSGETAVNAAASSQSMTSSEIRRVSARLNRALTPRQKQRKPKLLPYSQLPPDVAEFFCPKCHDFIGSSGCPKHPLRQEKLWP